MRYSTMPQWVYVLPIVLGDAMVLAAAIYTVVSPGPIGIIWLAMDTVFVIVCVRALGTRKDDERVLRDGVRARATVLGGVAILPDAARLAGVFLAVAIMPPTWRVDQREREALSCDAIRSTHPVCLQVQSRLRAIRRESGLLRHSSLPASQQRERRSSFLYRQA